MIDENDNALDDELFFTNVKDQLYRLMQGAFNLRAMNNLDLHPVDLTLYDSIGAIYAGKENLAKSHEHFTHYWLDNLVHTMVGIASIGLYSPHIISELWPQDYKSENIFSSIEDRFTQDQRTLKNLLEVMYDIMFNRYNDLAEIMGDETSYHILELMPEYNDFLDYMIDELPEYYLDENLILSHEEEKVQLAKDSLPIFINIFVETLKNLFIVVSNSATLTEELFFTLKDKIQDKLDEINPDNDNTDDMGNGDMGHGDMGNDSQSYYRRPPGFTP